jgi:hypothetical protein
MTFADPSWLWALTGITIPLAIHLLSRKEGKVIRVGSLRHVEESNTSQFKSIRLNEILLLLLRCLMVATIVLLLSGAQCSGRLSKNVKWVFAERGINVDSLTSKGYELREMPGGNYWSFVEELNKLPYDIVVVSFSYVKDFNGKRTSLNDNIKWITAEPVSKEYDALAWAVGDSVFVRTAKSGEAATVFETRVGFPDSIKVIKPSAVKVNSDDPIVVAALNTLKKEYRLPISFAGNQNIIIKPSVGPLVERVSPTEIHINKSVDQDLAVNENLVIELFKVLYPELQKPEIDKDVRVLPDEMAFSKQKLASAGAFPANTGIEKYLIALFLITLATERFVAIRRNQ